MEENKILQFNKDHKFYFKKGSDFLHEGNFLQAIKYILKAIDIIEENGFLKSSYKLLLAQAYNLSQNYGLSNLFYFQAMENEIFSQIAFYGLGENFLALNDENTSRFYFNQCINLFETSKIASSALERLSQLDSKKKELRVVESDKFFGKEKLLQAENFMSKGKFEKAIELFENFGDYKDPKIRAELSLAYFFVNDTEKGIALIKNYGSDTILDLCNLLLIFFCENNIEQFNETKQKLLHSKVIKDEEYFKIGLTFAQTGDLCLAKEYMQRYLKTTTAEPELQFLFALTCINDKDFETAKTKLIDLKSVDPFNNFVFDYYLKLCDEKRDEKVEYIFNVPVKAFLEVQNKMKELLVLDDESLKQEFLKDIDLFYFISSLPDGNTKNIILLKLANLEDRKINDFFDYVLLSSEASTSLKIEIVLRRMKLKSVQKIMLTRDNIYTKIQIPNMKALKITNQCLCDATFLVSEFLLKEAFIININFKRNLIKLEKSIMGDQVSQNVLASFITWDYAKSQKLASLNKICKYFKITQAEFYDFVEKYHLEV